MLSGERIHVYLKLASFKFFGTGLLEEKVPFPYIYQFENCKQTLFACHVNTTALAIFVQLLYMLGSLNLSDVPPKKTLILKIFRARFFHPKLRPAVMGDLGWVHTRNYID